MGNSYISSIFFLILNFFFLIGKLIDTKITYHTVKRHFNSPIFAKVKNTIVKKMFFKTITYKKKLDFQPSAFFFFFS